MMTIIAYICISIVIIALLVFILFFIRITKVHKFRIYILKTTYNHSEDYWNNIDWDDENWFVKYKLYETSSSLCLQISNKYEYDEMLYSIKPLELDKWFTEEEVNFIKFGTLK